MWACALALLLYAQPAPVRVLSEVPQIEASAVRSGLELRLPADQAIWQVLVMHAGDPDHVVVRLTSPAGEVVERRLPLIGDDEETRSRALASALALIIEHHRQPSTPEPEPTRSHAPASPPMRGWLAASGEFSLTRSYDIAAGLGLWGGTWVLENHVQPLAGLSWLRAERDDLELDTLRGHLGLLGGAEAAPHVWLGAGVIAGFQWLRASSEVSAQSWSSVTRIPAVAQFRLGRFVLGIHTGVELLLPSVRARSSMTQLRLRPARFFFAISFGGVLGSAP